MLIPFQLTGGKIVEIEVSEAGLTLKMPLDSDGKITLPKHWFDHAFLKDIVSLMPEKS